MRTVLTAVSLVLVVCVAAGGASWGAGAGRNIERSPLDHVTLFQDSISKDTPVRVQRFGTENADLGTGAKKNKPKYRQIAMDMKENAPRMILLGAIEEMQERGFGDVAELKEDAPLPEDYLLVRGEFTVLDPGSQGKRYWVGFGAGKSKVCATGEVVNAAGETLMKFDHCRHEAIGAFGGDSEGQMTKDSYASGSHFAEFMDRWAQGKYGD